MIDSNGAGRPVTSFAVVPQDLRGARSYVRGTSAPLGCDPVGEGATSWGTWPISTWRSAGLRGRRRRREAAQSGAGPVVRAPARGAPANVNVPSQRQRTFLASYWALPPEGCEKGTSMR